MIREEQNRKLKAFITCLKCEVSGKSCDDNCPTQYEAGNMGEIIENLETIAKALEQEPCEIPYQSTSGLLNAITYQEATNLELCEDCISRKEAIKVASGYCHPSNIAKELANLPSVQPTRPHGKWTKLPNSLPCMSCQKCGSTFTLLQGGEKMNYCPNCGCYMRGSEND